MFIAGQNHTGGAEYLVASKEIKSAADLVGKRVSFGTDPEENSINWAEWADQLNIPAAVSYTHLDVYKRQVFIIHSHNDTGSNSRVDTHSAVCAIKQPFYFRICQPRIP